eukprot:3817994-Pyramimonas_sp.AAC.1
MILVLPSPSFLVSRSPPLRLCVFVCLGGGRSLSDECRSGASSHQLSPDKRACYSLVAFACGLCGRCVTSVADAIVTALRWGSSNME